MKKLIFFSAVVLVLLGTVQPLIADDYTNRNPWEKFSFNAGAFLTATNTSLRFGSGLGVSVDLEEALDMSTENSVYRFGGYWRFTNNRRHRLGLSWFSLHRSARKTVTDQIVIEPHGGGEDIIVVPGTEVKSKFNLDIYQLNYSYSIIQDDRLDFAAQAGLYIMPISFSLSASGLAKTEADQSFTAPLPEIGLRFDLLIAPKWYLRTGSQVFYIEYEDYTGSLLDVQSAIEYNPWKHVGFGIGFDVFKLALEANGNEAIPGMDLRGNVAFQYVGAILYGRIFF
jgi:hypothetical protein